MRLGGVPVLTDVSIRVAPGEQVALIGPSGAGKSTLLRLVAGFLAPDGGAVGWDEERWSDAGGVHLPPRRRRIGMVAQDLALWPHLTARAHLAVVLRLRGVPRRDRQAAIETGLAGVGLLGHDNKRPAALSGGEAQRLALARALAGGSRLLLLDEPLGQLDVALRADLSARIGRLAATTGAGVLHVTHAPEDALQDNDRVIVLEGGRVIQDAPPRELVEAPASRFVAAIGGRVNQVPAVRVGAFMRAVGVRGADPRFKTLPDGTLVSAPDALEVAGNGGLVALVERKLFLLGRPYLEVRAGEDILRVPGDQPPGMRVYLRAGPV